MQNDSHSILTSMPKSCEVKMPLPILTKENHDVIAESVSDFGYNFCESPEDFDRYERFITELSNLLKQYNPNFNRSEFRQKTSFMVK